MGRMNRGRRCVKRKNKNPLPVQLDAMGVVAPRKRREGVFGGGQSARRRSVRIKKRGDCLKSKITANRGYGAEPLATAVHQRKEGKGENHYQMSRKGRRKVKGKGRTGSRMGMTIGTRHRLETRKIRPKRWRVGEEKRVEEKKASVPTQKKKSIAGRISMIEQKIEPKGRRHEKDRHGRGEYSKKYPVHLSRLPK